MSNPTKLNLKGARLNLILDNIIKPTKTFENNLYDVEKDILNHEIPSSWNIHDDHNMERILEVDFAKYGILVAHKTGQSIDQITAFNFYSSVEALEEQYRNNKKNG